MTGLELCRRINASNLTLAQASVLQAIAAGHNRCRLAADATGLSPRKTRQAISELIAIHLVTGRRDPSQITRNDWSYHVTCDGQQILLKIYHH